MTDTGAEASNCPPQHLQLAIEAFQVAAFEALLRGEAPRLSALAESASRDAVAVAQAAVWLEGRGALERDGDRIVGAHGLTRNPTRHTLVINGQTLHTWCAFDSVAIPVALGVTATATTTCPTCGQTLVVRVEAGRLATARDLVLWFPTGPCHHARDDFCAAANLFCGREHLDAWSERAGEPTGRALALDEIPLLARESWADVAFTA